MNNRTYWTKYLSVFFGLLVPFAVAFAQQENDERLDTYNLAELSIEEIPIEENIMPTSRPFNSVYGTNRSILDTPRNVTIISREQLDAIAIKDVRDFSKLTSSSYTKTNFGSPSTPNLRGQEADLFVNGMRRGGSVNGNGMPINFNAVESVNIVKGPAGVVYGTTNYLGGYADLITKKPFFDGPHGEAQFSIGDYDQYTWNLDYGTPLENGKTAWRMSYEGKDWGGYWQFWKQKTHAIYFALTHMPSDTYTIEANIEFFFANYTENWGINRVSQGLVDKGEYIPNRQTDADYAKYVSLLGNGDGFWAGTAGVDFASHFGGAGFATIVPVAYNTVPVNRRWKLAAPGDDSDGVSIFGGIDQTWELANDIVIVNKTSFGYKDRNTFSSYHYSELMKDNYLVENRTEIRWGGDMGNGSYNMNAGVRFRYDDIWSVNHFYNEPVNFWDMNRDPNLRRVPDQGFTGLAYVEGQDARGILSKWWIGGDPNNPTGADSNMFNVGPFIQTDLQFTDTFSLLAGFTMDFLDATQWHPTLGSNKEFDYDGDGINEKGYKKSDTMKLINYNISPVFKVNEDTTIYATYNLSDTYTADTGGRPDVFAFNDAQESELLELGAKFSFLDDKFFLGAAFFDRAFTERNQDGSVDDVEIDGFEIEFNYQPSSKMFLTMGYSYLDAQRTLGFFASGYTIDRALAETGGFYVSPTFPGGPTDSSGNALLVNSPGTPEHLVNALLQYKFENGFGFTAGFLGWGEMTSGYEGFPIFIFDPTDPDGGYNITANTAHLPFQHEIDLSFFYEQEDWMVKLALFNITDEENWDANNSGYGNGSIVSRMPFRAEVTVRKRF
ncbi:MAG: TonB-dependent receptor plug domain-containing protein [Verrucomicrobia bacterium]|nr:TonB-dependent receptor plug domain-containing protein [Verrucomicrobiota bacterium]